MPARKTIGTKAVGWDPRTRERIQTSMLINRLTDHVKGVVELTPAQVQSAQILLRKSLPDLAAITVSGDSENPVETVIRWER